MRLSSVPSPYPTRALSLYEDARSAVNWRPREIISSLGAPPLDEGRRELAWRFASQGVYAEQTGLLVAAQLLGETDDLPARLALATAVADEARHSEAFMLYASRIGGNVAPPSESVRDLFETLAAITDPLGKFLVHTTLEGFAADEFLVLKRLFEGDSIARLYELIRRDESRHVAMGLDYLRQMRGQEERERFAHTFPWYESVGLRLAGIGALSETLSTFLGLEPARLTSWFMRRHRSRLAPVQGSLLVMDEGR